MADLFFFGTLRHLPLLEAVLGRSRDALVTSAAELPGHAVHWVRDQPFPILVEAAGQRAKGLLVRGLSDGDVARIVYYEGGFDYDLRACEVQSGGRTLAARVFQTDAVQWQPGAAWSLGDWARDWGDLSVYAAEEVMGYYGAKPAAEVARMFAMIRARAAARVNAEAGKPPLDAGAVQVHSRHRAYVDFFAVDDYRLSFRRFDGTQSPEVARAVFIGTDAAIVLPYDPVRDRVLLVEQMRMGPLGRGDPEVWQLEPVAGRLDAGETPEQTARRETLEEAGVEIGALHDVAQVYPSPGALSEYFYIYVGIADLPDAVTGVAGVASEAEDIRSHLMSFDELMRRADQGKLANAPLAVCAYWLARHRDRLRGGA